MKKGERMNEIIRNKISISKQGQPSPRKGVRLSLELRKKLSEAHLGHKPTEETLAKMRMAQKARGGRTYITSEWIEKLRLSRIGKMESGENRYNWISDRTKLKDDSKDRGGQLHREWSRKVKNRDKWKCRMQNQDCFGRMEAPHILGWKSHPELRYEINNGITLCHTHHPLKRLEEQKLIPIFQELVKG